MRSKYAILATACCLGAIAASPVFADDGELLRRSLSSTEGGIIEGPIPEGEHAFINYMKRYVPAQRADGTAAEIVYTNADGEDVTTATTAKPLIGVYIYGPVVGIEGTGFVGHGRRDAFAAVSLDDGETWKRTNLSESADLSSFEVSVPFPDPSATPGEIEFDPDGAVIEVAGWDPKRRAGKLEIEGQTDRRDRVEIRNAVTQEVLFSVRADRSGEFEAEKRLAEAPCTVQAGVDGVFGPPTEVENAPEDCVGETGPALITEYPGDVVNIFHAVAGNRVVAAWPSRFCQTGSPAYALDDTSASTLAGNLGVSLSSDLYLSDVFGVAGAQGSVDYSNDQFAQNQPVGEVPFNCLWTARGVLVEDDDATTEGVTEASYVKWFKAERLTSGRRDVNRVEIRMVEGAGAAVTWQEDPEGLRPGQGEGPGEGWSGAIANNQTDVWYSFLPWEQFDLVETDNGPQSLTDYLATGATEKPKHYVPFAVPMRLTNNAKCTLPVSNDDPYCDYAVAASYGLQNFCADTVDIPLGPQGALSPICVNEDGLPNVANTAATRPRLSLQPRDSDGDGVTDSAWVVVVAEEDKGFGRYFFAVGEDGETVDTATPCTEGTAECETADIGKNIWYYSFDMGQLNTSLDTGETGLLANLVSQGNMLNQPETDWRTGAFYPPLDTLDMWDFSASANGADYNFLIYRTEIARRGSLLVQSTAKAGLGSSALTALPSWKQGLINQGGPADVMLRRITDAGESANPYDYANLDCPAEAMLFADGSNPYYPKGLCTLPAINVSATTPETCEVSGDSGDNVCPTIAEDGSTLEDPTDQQLFDKLLTWYQCPGSDLCGDDILGSNLDDQSWHNPLDIAKGHRGFLDGDFVMLLYAWSPNYKLNAVGRDRYELYIRRSFDGGQTWTTLPAGFAGTDGVINTAMGATTCETMRDGATSLEDSQRCQFYAAGADEQARNVSQLQSNRFTVLDPRYTSTAATIVDENGVPIEERNASRYFIVYETGDNSTVADGEAEPLDLFYGRAVSYGDNYQVWSEEDSSVSTCLPTDALDPNFCNEFDALEGTRTIESGEASLAASPAGDFLYGVWAQVEIDQDEASPTFGEVIDADAMFRRVWYLDDYIPSDAPISQ